MAKRPDGWVMEEYVTTPNHLFADGELLGHDADPGQGIYTGIFWFEYLEGTTTRRYSYKTAPKWLLALHKEATGG